MGVNMFAGEKIGSITCSICGKTKEAMGICDDKPMCYDCYADNPRQNANVEKCTLCRVNDSVLVQGDSFFCRDCLKNHMIRGTVIDNVNHPSHYGAGVYETIKVIEAWKLGFHLGNAVKYISRAGKKGDAIEDIKKARWYLDRYIELKTKGGNDENGQGTDSTDR